MSSPQQKARVKIPRGLKPADRDRLGQDIINFIRERTKADNEDKKNQPFKEYSDDYAEAKGSERVNLTDTGDMLENLEVLRTESGFITVGYADGYDGMGKVEGNRKGTYGQKVAVTKPRDFLGVTDADIKHLVDLYAVEEDLAADESMIAEVAKRMTKKEVEELRQSVLYSQLGLDNKF